jgi:hypothetical protein
MLTRILRAVPLDTIDGRSQVGVAIRRIREELVTQAGGDVTAAQAILIDEIAKKAIIVRSVGEWLLGQETLIRDGRLLEVVMQHDRLTATLAALLERFGYQRQAREVPDLRDYIKSKGAGEGSGESGESGESPN